MREEVQGDSFTRDQEHLHIYVEVLLGMCVGGGLFHWCTLSKSSPLAQEHWFGFGTSFHMIFLILEKKAAHSQLPLLFPSTSDYSSVLTGFARG